MHFRSCSNPWYTHRSEYVQYMHNQIYRTKTTWESACSNSTTPVGHWLIFPHLSWLLTRTYRSLAFLFHHLLLSLCLQRAAVLQSTYSGAFRICRDYSQRVGFVPIKAPMLRRSEVWGLVLDSILHFSAHVPSRAWLLTHSCSTPSFERSMWMFVKLYITPGSLLAKRKLEMNSKRKHFQKACFVCGWTQVMKSILRASCGAATCLSCGIISI